MKIEKDKLVQINYVLTTRFTMEKGYNVESRRGGGGYIKVVKVQDNNSNFLQNALNIFLIYLLY